jgi:hypothetical protein
VQEDAVIESANPQFTRGRMPRYFGKLRIKPPNMPNLAIISVPSTRGAHEAAKNCVQNTGAFYHLPCSENALPDRAAESIPT